MCVRARISKGANMQVCGLLFLACVTHHVDGSQACSRLALFNGVAERLVVVGALGGEEGRVDQVFHEDGVDDAEETADLRARGRRR